MLLILLAVDWALAIGWWEISGRDVDTPDLLLYLLALPLALAAVLLLALKLRRTLRLTPEPSPRTDASPQAEDEPTATPPLPILASWMITSLGREPADVLDALEQRRARPRPDPSLLDLEGFPVMSSPVPQLDCEATERRLAAIPGVAHNRQRPAVIRTLALLGTLIEMTAADWPLAPREQALGVHSEAMAILRARASATPQPRDPLRLQVKLMLPDSFDTNERQLASLYLERILALTGLDNWEPDIELIYGDDAPRMLGLLREAGNAQAQHAQLIVACDSALCTSVIERWQTEERLFDQRHPNGLMPGEAGFAVLTATSAARMRSTVPPLCSLSHIALGSRLSSADLPGKVSTTCLGEQMAAVQRAPETSAPAAIAVCDVDHRASRTLECIDAMIEHLPGLDAVRDRYALGEACGHLGAATVPGLLALAAHQVARSGRPALLFNVAHPTERAAALLEPDTPSPNAEALQAA